MADEHQLGDGPVEVEAEDFLRNLGRGIDEMLNPNRDAKEWGFVIIMSKLDRDDRRANYLSNIQRDDVVRLLREQLRMFELHAAEPGGSA